MSPYLSSIIFFVIIVKHFIKPDTGYMSWVVESADKVWFHIADHLPRQERLAEPARAKPFVPGEWLCMDPKAPAATL
jgi:hypothetical protein